MKRAMIAILIAAVLMVTFGGWYSSDSDYGFGSIGVVLPEDIGTTTIESSGYDFEEPELILPAGALTAELHMPE